MKTQTFSISMTLKTNPRISEKELTESQIRKILRDALKSVPDTVDTITFEVVDMTDSIAYREQVEANRQKMVNG